MDQIEGNYQKNEPQIQQKLVGGPIFAEEQIVEDYAKVPDETIEVVQRTIGDYVFDEGNEYGQHGVDKKIWEILHCKLGGVGLIALLILVVIEL